ncbi:2-dehydro-3-deoxygalactonokinase [Aliiglaciecola sp. 3_MG-2023]|uniref:2-dehydro-3-deoxygalactonokinase n=1 Tax=Aliiglaciecola TaxID=1406885 RepID=UPI001C0925B7|nr:MULTISPECIES: 2-dehydro-3-deoxygalactonokinase [unclassified Aliiglaciecola]MBU2878970.1 2-dehydro-3-deoxygalactonokinase [Aliiglaciecola lipolytica]MDO6693139.1 2-dehydro-3-deoxygalactonokinase [Aliiglaciecola sp. 3_MG-2023]MDO6710671.1 2-dehydro-3-deoxygalactonokinase [Aliiglaciecola sp. 2_MG-2023]MDO6751921.1 2-dehydro-3-deoxygalactonokinase [Aliiglaciecola sp. 1_MG-2023]
MQKIDCLIIDWGTTNFRAFAMSANYQLVETKELNLGLLQVEQGKFAETLKLMLSQWLPEYQSLPIYMAGMVGSAKGWVNVDYAHTAAGSNEIATKAHCFHLPWGPEAVIFPGVCHQYEKEKFDVMRGEEVQLLGLAKLLKKGSFTSVLPGTHSKHAVVEQGKLSHFSSYLTGEFYALLLKHSLLGKGLSQSPAFDERAFYEGVADAKDATLVNRVFLAWTHRLFGHLSDQQVPDYLSGLLIAHELEALSTKQPIYLIGGGNLCDRYQLVCNKLNINNEVISGNECFLAGMINLIELIKN